MDSSIKITEAAPDHGVISCFCKQVLATIASCLIAVCTGVTFGITAVMLPQLREDKSIRYNPSQDSWIASIASLSMIVGSLGCGHILDTYGRKTAHIILGIPFIIGWTFIACANSTDLILVGRAVTGLASSASRAVTLVYIGEISDPKFRASALFLPELTGHIGIIFSHIVGHYLYWKVSAVICLVPAILSCITFLFLKESPMWLIAKGRKEEGIETFRWFRGTGESSEMELKILLERQNEKPKMHMRETLKLACTRSFIKPMIVLMVLMLDVQFSGLNVLIFYSQDIFGRAFSGNVDAFLLLVVMDCIRGVIAMCICVLGKRIPKKISFLSCNFGVSIFVFGLVMCFVMKIENVWASVFFLMMYIMFSSAIGTIGWTFVPELLPSNARGFGAGLNSSFAFFTLFIVLKFTPDYISAYGESALFGLYGASTFICGLFLIFVLPETNNRTLQSIEDSYSKNNKIKQTHL